MRDAAIEKLPDRQGIRFTKEYRVDRNFTEDFERAYAATGHFGQMFVQHGCLSYVLFKDRREPKRYIVTHTWPSSGAFKRAQEGAAQHSYDFQQQSYGWILSAESINDEEVASILENLEDRYEVLSEA